eukprot:939536-Rhodomonas_salina.3
MLLCLVVSAYARLVSCPVPTCAAVHAVWVLSTEIHGVVPGWKLSVPTLKSSSKAWTVAHAQVWNRICRSARAL